MINYAQKNKLCFLYSHNEHSKIKRPPLRRLLARGGAKGKVAWKEYIVKTMNYILEYNNQSSKALNSSVQEAAKKIIDFEAKLINVSKVVITIYL